MNALHFQFICCVAVLHRRSEAIRKSDKNIESLNVDAASVGSKRFELRSLSFS